MALRGGKVLLSSAVLAELYEVLHREKFRRYVSEEEVRTFLGALVRESVWVEVSVSITACRDPDDNRFLELGVSGQADFIISGDEDLLSLNPFEGIPILTPHAFLVSVRP